MTSLYLGLWIGQASCGCFGAAVQLNPWYAFGLDLVVVGALLASRPDLTPLWDHPRSVLLGAARAMFAAFLGVAGLLTVLVLVTSLAFGSPRTALAYFRGEAISVSPRVVDLGAVAPGPDHQVTVELRNWTERPVRIIGGTADCTCDVNQELPATIPPGESIPLTITCRLPSAEGLFARKVLFHTDCDNARKLPVQVVGRISAQ